MNKNQMAAMVKSIANDEDAPIGLKFLCNLQALNMEKVKSIQAKATKEISEKAKHIIEPIQKEVNKKLKVIQSSEKRILDVYKSFIPFDLDDNILSISPELEVTLLFDSKKELVEKRDKLELGLMQGEGNTIISEEHTGHWRVAFASGHEVKVIFKVKE